jgi:hypothetical protein
MSKDTRREQLIDIIKKEFVGPDPIQYEGMIQPNGEEILTVDPPRIRYSAGILFPQGVLDSQANFLDEKEDTMVTNTSLPEDERVEDSEEKKSGSGELLEDAEELINLSNAFRQSAISLTAAVVKGETVRVIVSAGIYNAITIRDPVTEKRSTKYVRSPLLWNNDDNFVILPTKNEKVKKIDIYDSGNKTNLKFAITYRYDDMQNNSIIYTFTLENAKKIGDASIRDEDCFFQTEFKIYSHNGFAFLPESKKVNINDEDYQSNQLLYRDVKSYAIGHGCSTDWSEDKDKVTEIKTAVFPTYEIKPIVPSQIEGVSLEMYKMSDLGNFQDTLLELTLMCEKYKKWIDELKLKSLILEDNRETAERHINNCTKCYQRMMDGVRLLSTDAKVKIAFQYMNRAMLLQQLHYNLPLQEWEDNGDGDVCLTRKYQQLPDLNDTSTWYSNNGQYGKWRPFQIAFILINLRSMAEKTCDDRNNVDLIWFPTGGGKTEAYLGLSAYTIFIRKLNSIDDTGTAILMRYTLRLLTAQQYERAASMICACEMIRREKCDELGESRVTIGLWVGNDSTPNKMSDAVKAYRNLYERKTQENPFIILKCPWCGAQMGPVHLKSKRVRIPGYKKLMNPNQIVFQCYNNHCDFSKDDFNLPLMMVDDVIYKNPPTLLLGTVDKFAMLPFRPEAQKIFGINNGTRKTPPDLIIQDELHLISGPLGSMVGHYETMINELCIEKINGLEIRPKIIASTATISRAKEQCNALYNCGIDKVTQFPPSGIDAGDSFFAIEDKTKVGRLYVGIMAPASSSYSMTNIRLYASLLYGAKEIDVQDEKERDPYWTNLGYFNSLRELGQTATWVSADIDEYLHTMYKRRMKDKEENYKDNRRYIWRCEELTSRIRSDKVPMSLQNLSITYPTERDEKRAVDICLATNMISVGVDIPRLGMMTVTGQPKTTSEYIQATSRVGRSLNAPGIIFTTYNPGKPRDRSHYEHFKSYHSRIYCHVEPTSVTPFSAPLRERALHAILVGMIRLFGNEDTYNDPKIFPSNEDLKHIIKVIEDRVESIDKDELDNTRIHIKEILKIWKNQSPQKYQDFRAQSVVPLMYPAGTIRNVDWEERGIPTPTSMRNVDSSCEVYVLKNDYTIEGD